MSAIQFITSGGMASVGGDLPEKEQNAVNAVIRLFGEKVRKYALDLQVPASILSVQQCGYLLVGKDINNYHAVFADIAETKISYRDFSSFGMLDLNSLTHQVRIEVGDVVWAFSFPINVPAEKLDDFIQSIVVQYVSTVLQAKKKSGKNMSEETASNPEIASGLQKFRNDFPVTKKTAFIIMKFNDTKLHKEIVTCIKDVLDKNKITALRADDKQYMDDLFPNVKVYMHGCNFGIAVFDRITEEDLNPNVSLEVGYMLGMGKSVLLLKDKNLKSLQTDLMGKLYKEFDPLKISKSLPNQIEKWLSDKGFG